MKLNAKEAKYLQDRGVSDVTGGKIVTSAFVHKLNTFSQLVLPKTEVVEVEINVKDDEH